MFALFVHVALCLICLVVVLSPPPSPTTARSIMFDLFDWVGAFGFIYFVRAGALEFTFLFVQVGAFRLMFLFVHVSALEFMF